MSYLWTGYGLTWLALAGYAWRLERRRRAAERAASLRGDAEGTERAGPGDGDGTGHPGSQA